MVFDEMESRQGGLLRLLRDTLQEAGLDGDLLLLQQDLDDAALETRSICALGDALNAVWMEALAISGDPAAGLRLPHNAAYGLGALTPLVVCADTVKQGLQTIAGLAYLISPTVSIRILTQESNYYIELVVASGAGKVLPQRYDFLAMMLVQHIRSLTGTPFRLAEFHRPGARLRDTAPWEDGFGCRIRFDAPRCLLMLDRSQVERPNPSADPAIFDFSEQVVRRTLMAKKQQEFSSRVRRLMEPLISKGDPRREDVAEKLGMSVRSLSRRLACEGTSFAEMVNDIRRELAVHYLRNEQLKLSEITHALGFVDPSNFYRACKRWFGHSPQQVREASSRKCGSPRMPEVDSRSITGG